jgi:hypothetical protein
MLSSLLPAHSVLRTAAPQDEVEQYFLSIEALNVLYHSKYWMGLNTTQASYPSQWNWTGDNGQTPGRPGQQADGAQWPGG